MESFIKVKKMSKDSKKALFIVSSPFQALCAIEAIYQYKIDFPIFIALYGQARQNNSNASNIIDQFGFTNNKYELCYQSFKSLLINSRSDIKKINIKKHDIKMIFIGDYFSPSQRIFSVFCSNNPKETIYRCVDDGNSTIEALLWGLNVIRFRSINIFLKLCIAEIFTFFNKVKIKEFFSIFALNNKNYKIEVNTLHHLKGLINISSNKNIYILGTNLCEKNLLAENSYHNYLSLIIQSIKDKFPNEKVIFCPHRGESKKSVSDIADQYNLSIYTSEYTIELDFVLKNISPVAIYSFGSTASYSLKILYPDTHSYIIIPETNNKLLNRTHEEISKVYQEQNIMVL